MVNPSLITRFEINNEYTNICYDLDSYKLKKEKDYTEYIKDLFDNIINIINNKFAFKKLVFKNFDTTKYEYITGENLTFIDEENWVFNEEERKRKEKFEVFDKDINNIINDNKDKLKELKELVFDNCTNYFIELILKFINSTKNDLDLLKIKKCGKECLDLNNILSLNIGHLIIFDTPLIVDFSKKDKKYSSNLERFKGKLGNYENLTIKINTLEHYCIENNLDFYNTLEIIVELINCDNFNKNICFEMNALPIIMTYLAAKVYYKRNKIPGKFNIPKDFNFKSFEERKKLIEKEYSSFKLKGLHNKKVTLKKNNIRNKYEIINSMFSKAKNEKYRDDYKSELFNLDIDYNTFFDINGIKTIILKDNLFNDYIEIRSRGEETKKSAFIYFIDTEGKKYKAKNYKIDVKTLNEIIYKNKNIDDFTQLFKTYLSLAEMNDKQLQEMELKQNNLIQSFNDNLNSLFKDFCSNSNEITIIFDNIKERKEFFCLLIFYREVSKRYHFENYKEKKNIKYVFPDENLEIKKQLDKYFIKEPNEDKKDKHSIFNYYYSCEEEIKLFGEPGTENNENNKMIKFEELKFKVEYNCYSKNVGDELWDNFFDKNN